MRRAASREAVSRSSDSSPGGHSGPHSVVKIKVVPSVISRQRVLIAPKGAATVSNSIISAKSVSVKRSWRLPQQQPLSLHIVLRLNNNSINSKNTIDHYCVQGLIIRCLNQELHLRPSTL
ncbi:hypothetical protein QAD02_016468 [Eretmocerus hayati]|uniref:Uncharacterized protein n=1 Tax=Eretmocerus hayati TaxID=131215 RepID=A0ACC2PCZ5_9HYME|nr:hypothetical protein QAD02_016468 [Eretmocerus hayati]